MNLILHHPAIFLFMKTNNKLSVHTPELHHLTMHLKNTSNLWQQRRDTAKNQEPLWDPSLFTRGPAQKVTWSTNFGFKEFNYYQLRRTPEEDITSLSKFLSPESLTVCKSQHIGSHCLNFVILIPFTCTLLRVLFFLIGCCDSFKP